jgi:glycosyltransferase involved in cell wall biosynthesis
MQAGFDHALGQILVTMDGDLQNDPLDIPALVAELENGWDLVAGYRERRQDLLIRRKIPSWIANRIIAWITGVRIRDNGCSLKAYRKELLERVHLYSDMHRFIPALAAGMAGARISEMPVRHHARVHGESKYGLSRVGKVLVDLLTVKMIRSFRMKPARMFGGGALAAGLVGLLTVGFALRGYGAFNQDISGSVIFAGVALLWFSLAVFLFMLGLVAQVAVSTRQRIGRDPGPLLHEVTP